MTPMQEQYNKLKNEYRDYIVLFRLGDFYEAFNKDAEIISQVLGITLTGRGKGESRHPMAGIPYHALPNYLPKLLENNLRVAIADQLTEAVPGKLVERKITKIVTPGTVIDEKSLDASTNNYIASIYLEKKDSRFFGALCYSDISTGEMYLTQTDNLNTIKIELNKISPKELIVQEEYSTEIKSIYSGLFKEQPKGVYNIKELEDVLLKHFRVKTLKGLGINSNSEVLSLGVLIKYLIECQRGEISHLKRVKRYNFDNVMKLDFETIKNLELIYSYSGEQQNTLLGVLNKCVTPMGKRKLRASILSPFINKELITERLNSVETFFDNRTLTFSVQELLKDLGDIERIIGRIGLNTVTPKDLVALAYGLKKIIELQNVILLNNSTATRLKFLLSKIKGAAGISNVLELIAKTLEEDPPVFVYEGGVIKTGFDPEIDSLRNIRKNSKNILAEIQQREIERTKISSLKISFNQVFGYYIEITKSHLDKVPLEYIRKQTLSNAERFITQELKELEDKILNAEQKLIERETALYNELKESLQPFIIELLDVSAAVAEIDLIVNFAFVAKENNYIKPEITESSEFVVKNGRHPVIEKIVSDFTANSTDFTKWIHILTGPNMSGKSTYIRQCALITLMAQIGSFVPADLATISVTDRIFTRVGASDNLSRGESTFMVEMIETANILNNATEKSLIILDEVGRGTSTYDGVAIAWSIVEAISKKIKCKTLFATHYHELIELEKRDNQIANFNVSTVEEKGVVTFLHKIVPGGASKSYGIHVASIAGMPQYVVKRAEEILKTFESDTGKKKNSTISPKKVSPDQLGLI